MCCRTHTCIKGHTQNELEDTQKCTMGTHTMFYGHTQNALEDTHKLH